MQIINYDPKPYVAVEGFDTAAWLGYSAIAAAVKAAIDGKTRTVIIECYPGVREQEILDGLVCAIKPSLTICTHDLLKSEAAINDMLASNITDDRVFGLMSHHRLTDFFDADKLSSARATIAACEDGVVCILGVGAALVAAGDILIYADLARWEIQQRYRAGELCNLGAHNTQDDILRKYKRGYFIDWRVADRHKQTLFWRADFFLDTNQKDDPRCATGEAVRAGMAQVLHRPFRVAPYFDAGVWGGHWMKERFGLPENGSNYAWGFDCVPEENSLLLEIGGVRMEFPAIDLVLFWPSELLGPQVYARFGAEFPIRFDLLDTMGGQNLSLQVHPLTAYIQDRFGMHYTQDESYYILDCAPGTHVYLGIRDDVAPQEMLAALDAAQSGAGFDAERFVNRFPAEKHHHFSIPAGTVHCSGADTMVLEISATPYIFTFKLWDWDRLGLDGLPRPVHLVHGKENIQFDRRTAWTKASCAPAPIAIAEGNGWREERTGLHTNEFIETRRHWFRKTVTHDTKGNLHVLNLVQGTAAVVESPSGAFAPFTVHYAETFIVPAQVDRKSVV